MKKLKIIILTILLFSLIGPGLAWADTLKLSFANVNLYGQQYHTTSKIITLKLFFANPDMWQRMSFSNSSTSRLLDDSHWSEPEPIAKTRKGWDLAAHGGDISFDGIKCVYAKFQNNDGNWSEPISACLHYSVPQEPELPPVPDEPAPSVKKPWGCLGF